MKKNIGFGLNNENFGFFVFFFLIFFLSERLLVKKC